MNDSPAPLTSVCHEKFFPLIQEILAHGKSFSFTPFGTSMLPLLRNGRDAVILAPVKTPVKRLDIILYKRNDGSYVLHRVIKKNRDGSFYLCGDHQITLERVEPEQIIAVAESLVRKNRLINCRHSISYRIYSEIRVRNRPFRAVIVTLKRRLKKLFIFCRMIEDR